VGFLPNFLEGRERLAPRREASWKSLEHGGKDLKGEGANNLSFWGGGGKSFQTNSKLEGFLGSKSRRRRRKGDQKLPNYVKCPVRKKKERPLNEGGERGNGKTPFSDEKRRESGTAISHPIGWGNAEKNSKKRCRGGGCS